MMGAMDYKNPQYVPIFRERMERLARLRANPQLLAPLKTHYRSNPIDFIRDWGVTSDPRNIERGLPAVIPLIPFEKQVEWLEWLLHMWRTGQSGLTEKSRDMGCSVNAMALFCTLALFNDGFVGGVGSRKEMLVDKVGDPSTLFYKARQFLANLPVEFRGGWSERNKLVSAHMKIEIPNSGSVIIGEAGDNIGRGGRASIYLVDESAFLTSPMSIEASLSQTTRCRIDLSSVNGMDNPFAEKRHSGKVPVFTFRWRDDPRKDQAWYDSEVARLNPIVVAQEIDLDYSSSKEGILIPSAWVQAAINAHVKLKIMPTGARRAGLDVADEGIDLNAFSARYGFMLEHIEAWSGQGSNIFKTTERSIMLCDRLRLSEFDYDSDGLGVGVRGDAEQINARPDRQGNQIKAHAYRGSESPVNPEEEIIKSTQDKKGRTNEDFFKNRKAQSWWHMRTLFENTFKAVTMGHVFDPSDIISIPQELPNRDKLETELSQPTYSIDNAGKIIVDKAPDGMRSPNYADSLVICYAPQARKRIGALGF
jgi:hypothetical protein